MFNKYTNNEEKLDAIDNEGYRVSISIYGLRKNVSSTKFEKSNPYIIDNIKLWLLKNNLKYELLSNKYTNSKNKMKWFCKNCEMEFEYSLEQIQSGRRCKNCEERKEVTSLQENSLYYLRPDLHKYIIDLEYAKTVSIKSNKKIKVKCPECGEIKKREVYVSDLSNRTMSCDYCSDSISIPEKFCRGLLKQLKIKFDTQNTFKWSNRKRYDFYIKSSDILIETHGEGHYRDVGFSRSLKEEQENDLLKYNIAIQNGVKPENYIVIDCRKSEFEWLKENHIQQLENHFDLSNIDWHKIWLDCQKSIVTQIWDAWNNKDENDTTKTIGQKFRLGKLATSKYLKTGSSLGKCEYDPKEEQRKSAKRANLKKYKTIHQYDKAGNYIKTYDSIKSASESTGINSSCISSCLSGKTKSSSGFIWRNDK